MNSITIESSTLDNYNSWITISVGPLMRVKVYMILTEVS